MDVLNNLSHKLIPRIRRVIYRIFSEDTIRRFLKIQSKLLMPYSSLKIRKAKKIFDNAPESPPWLGLNELRTLQKEYPFPFNNLDNRDPSMVLSKKGKNYASKIIKLSKSAANDSAKFLELGCNDGMVCFYLESLGKEAIGIDIDDGFDKRALEADITLLKMDASNLNFESESFDCVFSFNCFEHFSNPDKALEEALRVVKKNGYIYIEFTPLFMAPWGLHAFKTISIPYCQFLFPLDLIRKFAKGLVGVKPLPSGDLPLNKWSVEQFRKLWIAYSNQLEIVKYREIYDTGHLDLVMRYPSCFKSKTNNFDNLIVSSIELLFKRIK